MICSVWHVIARLSPAEEEESSEVRLWRKLCFGTTTCLFSDWVSRSLFYLQHLIRVCSSLRAYLIISTSLSTNNFLLRLSKQYLWLKPTIHSAGRDYYFVRKPSVMLMICLIFLSPKVRESGVGGLQPGYVTPLHSAQHRDIPQPVLTIRHFNHYLLSHLLPPHKLPTTFSPVCFAPFSEFHHTTPLWLHLLPPSLDWVWRQTNPSRADDFTDHHLAFTGVCFQYLTDRMRVCQAVKYDFISRQTSPGRGTHAWTSFHQDQINV